MKHLPTITLCLLMSNQVFASELNVEDVLSSYYVSLKTGTMNTKELNPDIDASPPISFAIGYQPPSNLGVEFEYTESEVSAYDLNGNPHFKNAALTTTAVYGTFRRDFNNSLYVKWKVGAGKLKVDGNHFKNTCFSGGVIGGLKINEKFSVETEFTYFQRLGDFLRIGISYHFLR